jgi:hypothetical protein
MKEVQVRLPIKALERIYETKTKAAYDRIHRCYHGQKSQISRSYYTSRASLTRWLTEEADKYQRRADGLRQLVDSYDEKPTGES